VRIKELLCHGMMIKEDKIYAQEIHGTKPSRYWLTTTHLGSTGAIEPSTCAGPYTILPGI